MGRQFGGAWPFQERNGTLGHTRNTCLGGKSGSGRPCEIFHRRRSSLKGIVNKVISFFFFSSIHLKPRKDLFCDSMTSLSGKFSHFDEQMFAPCFFFSFNKNNNNKKGR